MENSQTKKRIFVVIHTVTSSKLGFHHVLSQTAIAQANGADGVVLIPDYAKKPRIMATYEDQLIYIRALKKEYPDFSIGANFLLKKLNGLEEDICSLGLNLLQTDEAEIGKLSKENLGTTELFCGVGFKYTKSVNITGDDLKAQCNYVASICDVPTTSGEGTGVAAEIEKIEEIRRYLGPDKRLAVASGVGEENVLSYIQAGATDFLVASSLILPKVDGFGRDVLDSERVSRLVTMTHSTY